MLNSPNKLTFICKQLSITDDADFGCTIEFSDSVDTGSEDIHDIVTSNQKYLLIQRTYSEDEDETDWYTVETSECDVELNQNDKIIITLKTNYIEISWSGFKMAIGLELSKSEFNKLLRILNKRFKRQIILLD